MSVAIANLQGWLHANAASPPTFGDPRTDVAGPLADLYAAFDGQLDGPPLIGPHRILTWEDAQFEKAQMDRLAAEEGWDDAWWSTDWHPFATDDAGQLLVVEASSGRVLEFLHDDDPRPEIAPDLERLFVRIWTALHAGVIVFDPAFGIGTPDEVAAYHAARERLRATPPREVAEGRPGLAMAFALIPGFAWFALGVTFEWGPGVTVLGMTAIILVLMGVATKLGWVVHKEDPLLRAAREIERARNARG